MNHTTGVKAPLDYPIFFVGSVPWTENEDFTNILFTVFILFISFCNSCFVLLQSGLVWGLILIEGPLVEHIQSMYSNSKVIPNLNWKNPMCTYVKMCFLSPFKKCMIIYKTS